MSDTRDQSFPGLTPPPPAAPRPLPPAGWFPDPSRRHEHRYWDGRAWTEHVADHGIAGTDSLEAPAPQTSALQPSPALSATAETTPAPVPATATSAFAAAGVAPPPSVPTTPSGWFAPAPTQMGPAMGRVRSLAGLTTALTVMLWISAGIAVIGVIAYVNRVAVINDVLDANSFNEFIDLSQRADDADTFVGVVVLLMILAMLTIFTLLIIWMWRAAKNNEVLGRTNPRLSSGWAIGAWFIPFANLVMPLLVMLDLWRGSDPESPPGDPLWRTRSASPLVGWWWGLYLASLLKFGFGGNDDGTISARNELESLRTQDQLAIFGMAATVAAAILLILVVRRITARQAALLGAQPPA